MILVASVAVLIGCQSRGGLPADAPDATISVPDEAAVSTRDTGDSTPDSAVGDLGLDLADPACAGKSCDTPPAPLCMGSSLRTYAATGTCAAGTCTYLFSETKCNVACVAGKCSNCAAGFTEWPCYPPAMVATTCCVNGQRTCSNGRGCTCYDACN